MNSRLHLLFVFVLSFLCVAFAQQSESTVDLLEQFPPCAQRCIVSEFVKNTCSPTDNICICSNEQFQTGVTHCVTQNCTVTEALSTKNTSSTSCGLPVRDRGPEYYYVSCVIISFAWFFILARFAFKIYEKLSLGLDDWTILVAVCVGTALTALTIGETIKQGLGKDIWTLEPRAISRMLLYFEIVAILYFTTLTLVKLSIIFFYIRVFTTPGAQRLLWGTAIFTIVWGLLYVLLAIFQCVPMKHFWQQWDGVHEGHCLNINAITASNAGISIVLDFWSLGVPLWQLRGLKMHWKKKAGVALMVMVGTFVTIVSILRLHSVVYFAKSTNVSWEFYDVSIWSSIELGVGAMCSCMPALRLMLVKIFPILGGSSERSNKNYRKYGNQHNDLSRSKQPQWSSLNGTSSQGSKGFSEKNSNIVVKTSYNVDHTLSDAEDISLVEMHRLSVGMSSKNADDIEIGKD